MRRALQLCLLALTVSGAHAQELKHPIPPPERSAFFKVIQQAAMQKLDCAHAEQGMHLAIQLTSDVNAVKAERLLKGGYVLEDISTWAMKFLPGACEPQVMKPLVDELIAAESRTAQSNEPGLAFSLLDAAEFYRTRVGDAARAAALFDRAAAAMPEVQYEDTASIIPEHFARTLAPYEAMLAGDARKKARYEQIRILRMQQQARHMNNAGNKYLDGVFEPVAQSGLHEYEVTHAVEAYGRAIELTPTWADPYRGRARAYELLGKTELAAKDKAQARKLDAAAR